MDLKLPNIIILYCLTNILLGCTDKPNSTSSEEGIIQLASKSRTFVENLFQSRLTNDQENILVFDSNVNKIHKFAVSSGRYDQSYAYESDQKDHFFLHSKNKQYFLDLTKSEVLLSHYSSPNEKFTIAKNPIAVHYVDDLDYIAVRCANSIEFMALSSDGYIKQIFTLDFVQEPHTVIQSSELTRDGNLIVSVKDSKGSLNNPSKSVLYIFDVKNILPKNLFRENVFPKDIPDKKVILTDLISVDWIASDYWFGDFIFVKSTGKLSSINTKTLDVQTINLNDWVVEKISRFGVPHVVLRDSADLSTLDPISKPHQRKIVYLEDGLNGKIREFDTTDPYHLIVHSEFWGSTGTWILVSVENTSVQNFNSTVNSSLFNRKYRYSTRDKSNNFIEAFFEDDAIISINNSNKLAMYSSKLGYAIIGSTLAKGREDSYLIENFNLPFIKK